MSSPAATVSDVGADPESCVAEHNVESTEPVDALNYFVCTLRQAAVLNTWKKHVYSTVNELLDIQAIAIPDSLAVAFPDVSDAITGELTPPLVPRAWTFGDIQKNSVAYAVVLRILLRDHTIVLPTDDLTQPVPTVALLARSSPDFLFAWLALMRIGYSVLLIAPKHFRPQCAPPAVVHLYRESKACCLLYDPCYEPLVSKAATLSVERHQDSIDLLVLNGVSLLEYKTNSDLISSSMYPPFRKMDPDDVAYFHHTSGTSMGMPKLVPQNHYAAVGVLPCLDKGPRKATFSTTPLYHGGIADVFRAWTSGALIWLFPSHKLPLTAFNVVRSLEVADVLTKYSGVPAVKYFSSVPYVLEMVALAEDGLQWLQRMDIVGVGGAALSEEAGSSLVERGVNLISRFGSAECGFLLSSYRDFSTDREWQYLRSHCLEALSFEPRDGGTFELVVNPGWPHMSKVNRVDGSYATSDLFTPHPTLGNAWKYHGRGDCQITLATGKKFDPAPLEASLASCPFIEAAYIFGDGQLYPGALIFPSAETRGWRDRVLLDMIWVHVQNMNASGQAHTKLSKQMLVITLLGDHPLERSSKGTVLRGQIARRFATQIRQAYADRQIEGPGPVEFICDEEVEDAVLKIVNDVIGGGGVLDRDTDLFSRGVDSVAAMQIRSSLREKLLSLSRSNLPLNVVYDCGTVTRLARFIVDHRHDRETEVADEPARMIELVQKYSVFETMNLSDIPGSQVVILTGATGALGAFILDGLRELGQGLMGGRPMQIMCLVRATDPNAARERVNRSLIERQMKPLRLKDNVVACPVKFGERFLGLSSDTYKFLAGKVALIIHAAWAVNFNMRLESFVNDHIAGVNNLINLALAAPDRVPPTFIFCSSTASMVYADQTPIPEAISFNPHTASSLGYSRSKWVAEGICHNANKYTALQGRIGVLRIGQLCGDSSHGVWNTTEAYPLILSTVLVTGTLPRLEQPLDWLPIDIAARSILSISLALLPGSSIVRKTPVYHILNQNLEPNWTTLLGWFHNYVSQPKAVYISPRNWISQLENLEGEGAKLPHSKLIGLWKDAYCPSANPPPPLRAWATDQAKAAAPPLHRVAPITQKMFLRMWEWLEMEWERKGWFKALEDELRRQVDDSKREPMEEPTQETSQEAMQGMEQDTLVPLGEVQVERTARETTHGPRASLQMHLTVSDSDLPRQHESTRDMERRLLSLLQGGREPSSELSSGPLSESGTDEFVTSGHVSDSADAMMMQPEPVMDVRGDELMEENPVMTMEQLMDSFTEHSADWDPAVTKEQLMGSQTEQMTGTEQLIESQAEATTSPDSVVALDELMEELQREQMLQTKSDQAVNGRSEQDEDMEETERRLLEAMGLV
ncbi:MAG: hypothetical protein M1819_005395 [Sarea resinae]|nr:MAG: hypothetical protein M1819_005395 [Sarea resinae]